MSLLATNDTVMLAVASAVAFLIGLSLLLALTAMLLRMRNEARAARWSRLEAKWTPALLSVLSEELSPKALTDLVAPDERRAFVGFVTRFTQRVRGREFDLLRAIVGPSLPLIEEDLAERSAERRARAVRTLAEIGLPEYESAVIRALDDESDLVAMVAARRLFSPGNERHFLAVIDRLSRFSLWSPRFLAGMLASGGSAAIAPLRGILLDPRRSTVESVAALSALRLLNDPGAADMAAGLLGLDPHPDMKVASLRLIALLGHSAHAEAARSMVKEADPPTRQAAIEALAAVGNKDDLELIQRHLADPSPWVRMGSARAIEALGARELLLEVVETDGPGSPAAREVLGA